MTHSTHTTSGSDALSLTFAALADPTRRAMLARLGEGPATVTELSQPFKISAPAISKHIKVLEKAGLITREKEAQWRRCRIEAARLREANEFIEKYKKFWEDSFDRLEIYLRKLQAGTLTPQPPLPEGEGEKKTASPSGRGQGEGGEKNERRKNKH